MWLKAYTFATFGKCKILVLRNNSHKCKLGIIILSCREIPMHNMPKGITFAEKTKNDNDYEKESVCFSVALLFDIGSS